MGVLLERPDTTFFSTIPHICEAVDIFNIKDAEKLLANFGPIFAKYNLCADYGLTMVHRHFDLSSNEILVEAVNSDHSVSVALPWGVTGELAEPATFEKELWTSYDLKEEKFIQPQTWSFDNTGTLKPFEYQSTNEMLPNPPTEFVSELFNQLQKFNLQEIVGIRRLDINMAANSWETTPKDKRANVTRFGDMPEDVKGHNVVKVVWRFDKHGKLPVPVGLCFVCTWCRHCNHCGTCSK